MSQASSDFRQVRWGMPVVIAILAGSTIAYAHYSESVESYVAAYLISAVILLAALALLIWFLALSGFARRTRWIGLGWFVGFIAIAVIGIKSLTRVDGVLNGVGFPRLVWRWSPRSGENLPAIVASRQAVDLASTTPWDFPEFLGPGRHNALTGNSLARAWTQPPKLLWRQPIGTGWSSFAIVGSAAVTLEQRGRQELVVCYDLHTGSPLWAHTHDRTRFTDSQGGDGPRSTPTIFNGRVYAMGATGILDCLDGATGKPVWSLNVLNDPDRNQTYGKSCSPLIVDDTVIVTGSPGGPSLIAYRTSDGSRAWSAGTESPGYASPILTTLAGVRQIITINAASVTAHDPGDGRILWRFDWPGSMPKNIQPIPVGDDRLLISAGYGLGTTLLKLQSDAGLLSVSPLWNSRHLKPKLSNNVIHGNFVFGLDDPGVLTCLDLSTGKRMWRDGSYGFGQVLAVDDLILVECESGQIALVEARSDALHELGRFTAFKSRTWSGPALAGHTLLVRNDEEAACFNLP
jgi:outer membrane protein assembly factor BamB